MVGLTPMTNMKFQGNQVIIFNYAQNNTIRCILVYLYTYRIDAAEVGPFPPPLPRAVLTIGGVRHTFVDAAVLDIIFRSPILWDFFETLPVRSKKNDLKYFWMPPSSKLVSYAKPIVQQWYIIDSYI